MELIQAKMPSSYNLYAMSDLHLGSPNCCEEKIETVIETIRKDPKGYLVFLGDSIEAITNNDKRFTHSDRLYKTPQDQADKVVSMFKPIAKKIKLWLMGNHGYNLLNTFDADKHISNKLGIPYGGYCAKLICSDNKGLMHKMFFTHGMGSVNSSAKDALQQIANRKAALKLKLTKSGHGDCILAGMGHTHQLLTVDPVISDLLFLTDDGHGIHQHYHQSPDQTSSYISPDARWFINTGSFMKLYSTPGSGYISYAEVAGFPPSEIGCIRIECVDRKIIGAHKIVV